MSDLLFFFAFVGALFGFAVIIGRFIGVGSSQDENEERYYSPEVVEMLRKKSL